jgi:hypothetical protein
VHGDLYARHALYRATYHAALLIEFGKQIGDAALRDTGVLALEFIRETL